MTGRMELSPAFERLIEYLDREGAFREEVQRPYEQIEQNIDVPARSLARYIKRAEQLGLVRVRRTTSGGRWGAPRVHNFYKLRMTYAKWLEVAPEKSEALLERRKTARAKKDLGYIESRAPKPIVARPPAQQPEPEVSIGVLARGYLDDDDLLEGW